MKSRRSRGKTRSFWLLLTLTGVCTAGAWPLAAIVRGWEAPSGIELLEWVEVTREDFDTTLLAGGDLQPAKQTQITCQVEDITESDGTIVLSLVKNGTPVKKGDELCRLDSSALDEMARSEEIAVGQARALHTKASLDLETARMALKEYEKGLVTQSTKEFEARIALARSDAQRQGDRLAWVEGMTAKGYLAVGQLLSDRHTLTRLRHELAIAEGQFRLFQRFEVPRELHRLRSEILKAENNQHLEVDRLKIEEAQLAYLRKQVENCTIRAPQDGVVVYANGNRWFPRPLEPGTPVYEGQNLFLIPDLTRMEVSLSVHETMGPRVRAGMKARVRIASRPDRVITGKVAAIEMLSMPNWKEWDDNVRHFLARIQLDETPPNALPLMSATVEIDTGRVSNALVIPVEALAIEDGEPSCYVVSEDGLERRPIQTRRATATLLEVTGGLNEGEHVVSRSVDVDLTTFGELIHRYDGNLARTQPTTGGPAGAGRHAHSARSTKDDGPVSSSG